MNLKNLLLTGLNIALVVSIDTSNDNNNNIYINKKGDCNDLRTTLGDEVFNQNIIECMINDNNKLRKIGIKNSSLEENQVKKILSYDIIESLSYTYGNTTKTYKGFPPEINNLKILEDLYIEYYGNEDENVPFNLSLDIPNLKELVLTGVNNIDFSNISTLKNLEKLNIFYCNEKLPNEKTDPLAKLTKLRIFDLSYSSKEANCNEIPRFVYALKNLDTLGLHKQDISVIPDEICSLPKLENLDVSENKVKAFPDCLYCLNNISEVSLEIMGASTFHKENKPENLQCDKLIADAEEKANSIVKNIPMTDEKSSSIKTFVTTFKTIMFLVVVYYLL